jgi:branched-subunit amino acid transport protein AzlD
MKTGTVDALILTIIMAAVIFFCRVFPFLFFREKNPLINSEREKAFLSFIEKTVPPVAMTALAFNSITVPFMENPRNGMFVLIAAILTALIHLLRRSPLLSIFGGTAAYIVMERLI